MITTVLFDLDGTLLPMDQKIFIRSYFSALAARFAPLGYDSKNLIDGIWAGISAMVANDGSCTNETAFWNSFAERFGEKARRDIPVFEDFYRTDFQKSQKVCGYTPKARETITLAKSMGLRVILATNPLFPSTATESRIRWAGLEPEDFEFYTTYENSTHCKPNPAYYQDILERAGVCAGECLMVGNDATEDLAASSLGISVFLLTDCLINQNGTDLSHVPHGGFDTLAEFLNAVDRK